MRKFINQDDMKRNNCLDIFYLIKELKKTTRKEIKEVTNMSVGAISNITTLLLQKGYIEEKKAAPTKMQGRIPSYLQISSNIITIGVELGAVGIVVEVFNFKKKSLGKYTDENSYKSTEEIFEKLFEFLDKVFEEFKNYNIMSIGIGVQGMVDTKNQISVFMVSVLEGWKNIPVAKMVSERYNTYTYIEHDTECILSDFAEGGKIETGVLVVVDKGIGMATILNGKIVSGKGMWELGHTIAALDEVPGGENNYALEDYVSEMGIVHRYGMKISEIAKRAEEGEEKAQEMFRFAGKNLGIAIFNIRQLLNPQKIIISGRMTKYVHLYKEQLEKYAFRGTSNKEALPEFMFIGESQTARGAAMIAAERAIENIEI